MRLFAFIILFASLQSCKTGPEQKEPFKSMLKNCDEVNINFYNNGDTVHFETTDSLGIKYLRQAVSGNEETINDTCKPVGNLFFRSHGDTLFTAEFAVVPDVNAKNCNYVLYTHQGKSYKNRFGEKAYRLLSQLYPKAAPPDTTGTADTTQPVIDTTVKDTTKK